MTNHSATKRISPSFSGYHQSPNRLFGPQRGLRSNRYQNPFKIEFVAALAEQCGIAIENARIYDEQQRQLNYFKAVSEISRMIGETRQLDTVLGLIVSRLPEVMNIKACTIRLIESEKGKLELKSAFGLSWHYLERGPLDDELATYFILNGEPRYRTHSLRFAAGRVQCNHCR